MLESLFNKVVGLQHSTLLKNDSNIVVSCQFWKIFMNAVFIKHLWVTAPEHQKRLRFSDIFRGYGNLTSVRNGLKKSTKKVGQIFNSLSTNPKKWLNTLKPFVGNSRRIFECV